jgi:hypothetical protein
MKSYPDIAVSKPKVFLPAPDIDMHKWSVIACDQFTSEPEYWQDVQLFVGDSPSTLNLILPEVYLGKGDETTIIQKTQNTMRQYLSNGYLIEHEGFILVERTAGGKTRYGILMALDLEAYNYSKGSQSLIRATEGTVLDRLPPRIKIREGAILELPHILVLIDDPQRTVIEPIVTQKEGLPKLYDFNLMKGSGHLRGFSINHAALEDQMISALRHLADPDQFYKKYLVNNDHGVLLFAMGDGNHSLATAKAIWEKNKGEVGMDHPSRYALIELENVHDSGLAFEPIHRVVFSCKMDYKNAMREFFGETINFQNIQSYQQLKDLVYAQSESEQMVGVISETGFELISFTKPTSNLPVGSLQPFLDYWFKAGAAAEIDYVHGDDVVLRLGQQPGNLGLLLPPMQKSDLFKTVILDGALPRKTFSMGEAIEKRFYLESRKIQLLTNHCS